MNYMRLALDIGTAFTTCNAGTTKTEFAQLVQEEEPRVCCWSLSGYELLKLCFVPLLRSRDKLCSADMQEFLVLDSA